MCGTRINIYLCIAGLIGSGKNEAMKRAIKIRALLKSVDYGRSELASNRGLMNLIGEKSTFRKGSGTTTTPGPKKFLLQTNEIGTIFKKAAIDNSTLFEMLCDLWDENDYSVPDKKGIQSCDCRLSWVGGLPIRKTEDFAKVFGKQSSFGLHSRFLFAYCTEEWRYEQWTLPAAPDTQPIDFEVDAVFPAAECLVHEISSEAKQLYEDWYPRAKKYDPSGRLSYNLNKVAILTSSASHEKVVTAECMRCAIIFMEWQIKLREFFKPSDASNESAAFGEKVLNLFAKKTAIQVNKGEGTHLNWKRIAHDAKWGKEDGGWLLFSTIQNFLRVGELIGIEDEYNDKGEIMKLDPKFQRLPRNVRLPHSKFGN
jgi:hypothetical protein